MCQDSDVVVVGGGNSAGQAAVYLVQHVRKVHMVVRSDSLHRNMSSYLARRIESMPQIEVLLNTDVQRLVGDNFLTAVEIANKQTGEIRTIPSRALFSFIGAAPRTDWLPREIERDSKGFVKTGTSVTASTGGAARRQPYLLETSRFGVFAAGDVARDRSSALPRLLARGRWSFSSCTKSSRPCKLGAAQIGDRGGQAARESWRQAADLYATLGTNGSQPDTAEDALLLILAGDAYGRLAGGSPSDPYYARAVAAFERAGKLLGALRERISDGDWLGYLLPQLYCTLARCQAKAGRPDLAEGTYQDQVRPLVAYLEGKSHGPDPRPGRAAPAMTAAGPGQQGAVDVPWEKAKHPKRHGPGRSWGIPP